MKRSKSFVGKVEHTFVFEGMNRDLFSTTQTRPLHTGDVLFKRLWEKQHTPSNKLTKNLDFPETQAE